MTGVIQYRRFRLEIEQDETGNSYKVIGEVAPHWGLIPTVKERTVFEGRTSDSPSEIERRAPYLGSKNIILRYRGPESEYPYTR